jgi:hypothetical protein
MNAHLTPEELTEQLLGSSSLTVNAHLLDCPTCASELDRLQSSISNFRDSAHNWSDEISRRREALRFACEVSPRDDLPLAGSW